MREPRKKIRENAGRLKQQKNKLQMNKASGSLWNPNSWHWENKNYTKEATSYIKSKVLDHSFKKDDIKFIFTDIKKMTVGRQSTP